MNKDVTKYNRYQEYQRRAANYIGNKIISKTKDKYKKDTRRTKAINSILDNVRDGAKDLASNLPNVK